MPTVLHDTNSYQQTLQEKTWTKCRWPNSWIVGRTRGSGIWWFGSTLIQNGRCQMGERIVISEFWRGMSDKKWQKTQEERVRRVNLGGKVGGWFLRIGCQESPIFPHWVQPKFCSSMVWHQQASVYLYWNIVDVERHDLSACVSPKECLSAIWSQNVSLNIQYELSFSSGWDEAIVLSSNPDTDWFPFLCGQSPALVTSWDKGWQYGWPSEWPTQCAKVKSN